MVIYLMVIYLLTNVNKLTLNKLKTEYMIIGSRQTLANVENEPTFKLE